MIDREVAAPVGVTLRRLTAKQARWLQPVGSKISAFDVACGHDGGLQ